MKRLFAISLCLVFLYGCVGNWAGKTVTSYEGVGSILKVTYLAAKPSCDAGALPADKCAQAKKLFNEARAVYILTGTVLEAIIQTEDAISKQKLMEQYSDLTAKYTKIVGDLVVLLTEMGVLK